MYSLLTRGDALRACPWLSYLAPLARSFEAVNVVSVLGQKLLAKDKDVNRLANCFVVAMRTYRLDAGLEIGRR